MATVPEDPRNHVRCKYFLHGVCKKQDCPFSHEIKDKPSMVCTYYLKGSCTYGKQCRYDHIKPAYTKKVEKVLFKLPEIIKPTDKGTKTAPSNWWIVNAPEFKPGQKSHMTLSGLEETSSDGDNSEDITEGVDNTSVQDISSEELTPEEISKLMCPFAAVRECPYGEECHYVHGLRCDICERECLNPMDPEQQTEHRDKCLQSHERDMEYSFAIQRSEGLTCCICLDVVLEREKLGERRFGILESCSHSFCLECIRKWRMSSGGGREVKACPICRVSSGFVIPSEVWVDDPVDKEVLIRSYTEALSAKDCKYFDKGRGDCPFGTSCFYKHEFGDGSLETKAKPKMRFCADADGNAMVVRNQRLWDFIEERNTRDDISP